MNYFIASEVTNLRLHYDFTSLIGEGETNEKKYP